MNLFLPQSIDVIHRLDQGHRKMLIAQNQRGEKVKIAQIENYSSWQQ